MAGLNFQILDATLAQQQFASSSDDDGSMLLIRTSEHRKNTYRYAGNFTPVPTPTDVIMIQGSATFTLRVKRIMLTPATATGAGQMPVTLIRRSTKFTTQGSAVFTAITAGKHDAVNDGVATGIVATIGTANISSVGATAGNIGQARLWFPVATTGAPQITAWDFATRQDKAFILRGITDFLFINLNGAALPSGGTLDYEIEIEEDQS